MSHKANPRAQTNAEKIKAYFEANPTAHVPASSLAKALKMGPTICADAAGKLAVIGELHREKKPSGDSTKEVWIYSLPAPDTVTQRREAKAFKPLKPATGFRRETAIEAAPSIIGPQAEVHASAQPQPEVGQNTGSLGSDRPLRSGSLPEAQAGHQPPAAEAAPTDEPAGVADIPLPEDPEQLKNIINLQHQDMAASDAELIDLRKSMAMLEAQHNTTMEQLAAWEGIAHQLGLKTPNEVQAYIEGQDARAVKLVERSNEAQHRVDDLEQAIAALKAEEPSRRIHEICDEHNIGAGLLAERVEAMGSFLSSALNRLQNNAKAAALEQFQRILDEFHIESPAQLRIELELQKAQGAHIAELTAKAPEAYAVAAPKKPLQRFTARHSAEKAATAAARAVGSAEIYELHRIAKASRGAVVIREA